jgi:hypothetical protein
MSASLRQLNRFVAEFDLITGNRAAPLNGFNVAEGFSAVVD